MQQFCSQCGFESPIPARYCRQCGSTMQAETETSGAPTRNYGRQEPAPPRTPSAESAPLPPSIGDSLAGSTERYYSPPPAPMSFTPTTAPFRLKKNPLFMLAVIGLFLLIGTGAFVAGRKSSHDEGVPADLVELSREDQLRQEMEDRKREFEDRIREAVDRQREAIDRQREAMERAQEAAERAGEAGLASAPGNTKAVDLTSYEYPNASIGRSIRIPGSEMLSLQTADSFDKVAEYYQKKLGAPLILVKEDGEKTALYQSNGSPVIAVLIENDDEHEGQNKITVLRSPFPGITIEPPIPPAAPVPPAAPPAPKPQG